MSIESVASILVPKLRRLYDSPLSLSSHVSNAGEIFNSASKLDVDDSAENQKTRLLYKALVICLFNLIWYYFAPPSASQIDNNLIDPLLRIMCPILIRHVIDWLYTFHSEPKGAQRIRLLLVKILSTLTVLYLSDLIWNYFLPASSTEHKFRLCYGLISVPSAYILNFVRAMGLFLLSAGTILPTLFFGGVVNFLFVIFYVPFWAAKKFLPDTMSSGIRLLMEAHIYVWSFRVTLKVMIPIYTTMCGIFVSILMFPSKLKHIIWTVLRRIKKEILEIK